MYESVKGYPFELPFEQVASYFEVSGEERKSRPFVAYHALEAFITIDENVKKSLKTILGEGNYPKNQPLYGSCLFQRIGFI